MDENNSMIAESN